MDNRERADTFDALTPDSVETPQLLDDCLWSMGDNTVPEDEAGSRQLQHMLMPQPDHVVDKPASDEVAIAPTNAQFDSGYGSISDPLIGMNENDDAKSIRSIITNASRVSLPLQEKEHLLSAFTSDLCQDIGFGSYGTDERNRILLHLPDLLKAFALRLEGSVTSKAEGDAKEFLRQQRQ
jgi:hypothetical protein